MMIEWEVPVKKGEWVNAHDWLKEYNIYEAQELDKRRLIEWLMSREFAPAEGRERE